MQEEYKIEGTERRGRRGRSKGFSLKKFLIACVGTCSNVEIKLQSAYRLGGVGRLKSRNMDRGVLISIPDWSMKTIILDAL